MFASIRRYIVSNGREKDAIEHANTGWLTILKNVPGFLAYYFVDMGDGEMLGVSVFHTREGATQANETARDYVEQHLSGTLNRTMLLEGEVVAYGQSEP